MNSLDIIFLSILAFTLLRGLVRGLVKEFASIFGLVFGFIVANHYFERLALQVQQVITNPGYAAVISYITLFAATLMAVIVIAHILKKFLKIVMLGWIDRLGGGALGLGKGALVCSLILFVLTLFVSPRATILSDSWTSPYISRLAGNLTGLVPGDLKKRFAQKSQRLQQEWEGSLLQGLMEGRGGG